LLEKSVFVVAGLWRMVMIRFDDVSDSKKATTILLQRHIKLCEKALAKPIGLALGISSILAASRKDCHYRQTVDTRSSVEG